MLVTGGVNLLEDLKLYVQYNLTSFTNSPIELYSEKGNVLVTGDVNLFGDLKLYIQCKLTSFTKSPITFYTDNFP